MCSYGDVCFSAGLPCSHEDAGGLDSTDDNALFEEGDDAHSLTTGDSPNEHDEPIAHLAATDGSDEQAQVIGEPSSAEGPPLLVSEMPEKGSTTYVAARELLTEMSRSMEDLEKSLSARQKVGDGACEKWFR